jgi:hypothetical protein
MGAIEDVRRAFQDIVAPDLKALQVEVREGFASVEKQFASVKDGFASVEKLAAIHTNWSWRNCALLLPSPSHGTKPS